MPPRLARLVAVVAAIGLIVAALVIRSALAGDDEPTTGSERDGGSDTGGAGDGYVVVCDVDLGEAACDAAAALPGVDEVVTLDLAEVIDGALDGSPQGWDLWLTLDPMPGVLDTALDEANLGPLTQGSPIALASSPLAVLARGEQLPGSCGDGADWLCLSEVERPPVAVPGADTSLGAAIRAAGASALLGTTDFGIGTFRGAPEADDLRRLVRNSPSELTAAKQTQAMVQRGVATATLTTLGLAEATGATSQGSRLAVRALAPEVVVGVVLIGLGPDGAAALDRVGDAVRDDPTRDALATSGWPGASGPTTGLPAADLVYALREELGG